MEEESVEQLQQTMTTQCRYKNTYQTNIKTYVLLAHHIGEPTGQMVNCGGWEKDEHGKFTEKKCPVINCELTIGAWENKELNILTSEEEEIDLPNKWCDEEEVPAENICTLVRVTETIMARSQLLLNYGNTYWTDINEKKMQRDHT